MAERLRDHELEELVPGFHPAPPLGDDREPEAAGVLVELADQRVHPARVEARPSQVVERGEDSDIGRIAAKGAAADLGQLLDVVGAEPVTVRRFIMMGRQSTSTRPPCRKAMMTSRPSSARHFRFFSM